MSNIEANVVITDDVQAEIVSEIYSTYNRLKYHPERVIPDGEFIDIFTELCKREKFCERALAKDPEFKKLKEIFFGMAKGLSVQNRRGQTWLVGLNWCMMCSQKARLPIEIFMDTKINFVNVIRKT